VLEALARPTRTLEALAADRDAGLVLALAGVDNPHNLGAALRVAAHFGASAVLVEDRDARLGGAAMRTAEGGAEHVDLVRVASMFDAVRALRAARFRVLATSSHDGAPLFGTKLSRRTVFLFGSESSGLPRALLDVADTVIAIRGTGAVESLNLATAVAVCAAEHFRSR
jgi:TrmH RNA methyltransferase